MDEQCDTMDGFEEGAPGVLELLERAGKTGMEWMVSLACHFSGTVLPFVSAQQQPVKCIINTFGPCKTICP